MDNSLIIERFIDPSTRALLLDFLQTSVGAPAIVYGANEAGRVDRGVRSTQRLDVPSELRQIVRHCLAEVQATLAAHFRIELTSFEEPQLLRYAVGDFFVAHQDGNTQLLRDDSMNRRISVVVFLNASSVEPREGAYGGGSLVFHGRYPHFDQRFVVPPVAGSLVAFPSETTHEVTPVAHGLRYTMVCWYR